MKRQAIVLLGAFSCLAPLISEAQPPKPENVVLESIAGGDGVYPVRDALTVSPDGTVTFDTLSPIDQVGGSQWRTQNRIGLFSYNGNPADYKKIADALTAGLPESRAPDQRRLVQGYDSLHFGDAKGVRAIVRVWRDPQETLDRLAPDFVRLKNEALKRPVKAAELSCAMRSDAVACTIRAIGSAPVEVPNPDRASFYCTDRERHVLPLSVRPKNAKVTGPNALTLSTERPVAFEFSPLPKERCDDHVVMIGTPERLPVLISNEVVSAPRR